MRLRIIDINFWCFWLVSFYRRESGPHVVIHFYEYQRWAGPWFNFWKWEKLPNDLPAGALMPKDALSDPELMKAQVGTNA